MNILDINDENYLHKCTKCGVLKSNSNYVRKNEKGRARKYNSICNLCNKGSWNKYSNTFKRKTYKLKYFFNLSYEDWQELVNKQENKCAICGKPEEVLDRNLAVDHNHKNGKVRGLLCNHCNLGLGKFEDNIQLLQKAIKYLEETDGKRENL